MATTTAWRGVAILATALVAILPACSAAGTGGSSALARQSADMTTPADEGTTTAEHTPDVDVTTLDERSTDDEGSTVGDVAAGAMSDAMRAYCASERRTLEVAFDVHTTMTGSPPTSVDVMVGDLLREAPADHDIGPDGAIRAIPGGRCA
jgi:hypothetical protein